MEKGSFDFNKSTLKNIFLSLSSSIGAQESSLGEKQLESASSSLVTGTILI